MELPEGANIRPSRGLDIPLEVTSQCKLVVPKIEFILKPPTMFEIRGGVYRFFSWQASRKEE